MLTDYSVIWPIISARCFTIYVYIRVKDVTVFTIWTISGMKPTSQLEECSSRGQSKFRLVISDPLLCNTALKQKTFPPHDHTYCRSVLKVEQRVETWCVWLCLTYKRPFSEARCLHRYSAYCSLIFPIISTAACVFGDFFPRWMDQSEIEWICFGVIV